MYRSRAVTSPPPIPDRGVALVHSPRAGEQFAQFAKDRSTTTIAAISQAAATACGTGWKRMVVAERPTDDALLSLAAQLCKGP